jgi:uracil-DNA glycosylase
MTDNLSFDRIINDSVNYLETLKQYGVDYFTVKMDSPKLLNYEIMTCSFCSGGRRVKPLGFKDFPENVKVLFVVDMPKEPENKKVFSEDERVLFKKILSAMNLKIDEIFVIPALRCLFTHEDFEYKTEKFNDLPCSDFLKRAIKFIDPRCICFLGEGLLKKIDSASNDIIRKYPVFSTHSLDTLIASPGLKKDAWEVFKGIISKLSN